MSATERRCRASPPEPFARSASVSDQLNRLLGAAAVVVLCGMATACARPTGDFGRAQPSTLHDEIMPAVGKARAGLAGEPVSAFNLTDEEEEMHDRVWRFLVAPHADDWYMDTVVELQRTRLARQGSARFDPARYYRWLRQTHYQSSRIRYRTIADDARTDTDLAPSTFHAICRVLEVDRQREVASRGLGGLAWKEVEARRAENAMFISWFTVSLRYRYTAYSNALDHLLVETPHEEAMGADDRLGDLVLYVESAERGEFCFDGALHIEAHKKQGIPSRVLMHGAGEPAYRK